jgi:hypothetical protein
MTQLQEATQQSKEVSTSFSDQVEREYKYFEESRTVEIKKALSSYTEAKTDFHSKVNTNDGWLYVILIDR